MGARQTACMRGCVHQRLGPRYPGSEEAVSLLRQEWQLQHLHPCRAGGSINVRPPPASGGVCSQLAATRAHASHASAVAWGAAAAAAAAVRRDAGAPPRLVLRLLLPVSTHQQRPQGNHLAGRKTSCAAPAPASHTQSLIQLPGLNLPAPCASQPECMQFCPPAAHWPTGCPSSWLLHIMTGTTAAVQAVQVPAPLPTHVRAAASPCPRNQGHWRLAGSLTAATPAYPSSVGAGPAETCGCGSAPAHEAETPAAAAAAARPSPASADIHWSPNPAQSPAASLWMSAGPGR